MPTTSGKGIGGFVCRPFGGVTPGTLAIVVGILSVEIGGLRYVVPAATGGGSRHLRELYGTPRHSR